MKLNGINKVPKNFESVLCVLHSLSPVSAAPEQGISVSKLQHADLYD
jgi:hypothetical protein